VDSHTRLAYSEALDDETAATAIAFLDHVAVYFASAKHGGGKAASSGGAERTIRTV
jgi:hypothetical protein